MLQVVLHLALAAHHFSSRTCDAFLVRKYSDLGCGISCMLLLDLDEDGSFTSL